MFRDTNHVSISRIDSKNTNCLLDLLARLRQREVWFVAPAVLQSCQSIAIDRSVALYWGSPVFACEGRNLCSRFLLLVKRLYSHSKQ